MSKTPRTDEAERIYPYVEGVADFARQLETELADHIAALKLANQSADDQMFQKREAQLELAKAKETIRLLTTDVDYVGGIQYWMRKHHEALVAGVSAYCTARANAFEEAAEVAWCVKDQDMLTAKAAAIRKGEEK